MTHVEFSPQEPFVGSSRGLGMPALESLFNPDDKYGFHTSLALKSLEERGDVPHTISASFISKVKEKTRRFTRELALPEGHLRRLREMYGLIRPYFDMPIVTGKQIKELKK